MKTLVFFLPNHILPLKPTTSSSREAKICLPSLLASTQFDIRIWTVGSFASFFVASRLMARKKDLQSFYIEYCCNSMSLENCQLYVPQPQLKLPHPLSSHKASCCRNRCSIVDLNLDGSWHFMLGFHLLESSSWSWNRPRQQRVSASSAELSRRWRRHPPHLLRSLSTYHRLTLLALSSKAWLGRHEMYHRLSTYL